MTALTFSILLVIGSQVAYHLAVKSNPGDSHPFGVLIVVYGLAMLVCIVLSPLVGRPVAAADVRRLLSWPTGAAGRSAPHLLSRASLRLRCWRSLA